MTDGDFHVGVMAMIDVIPVLVTGDVAIGGVANIGAVGTGVIASRAIASQEASVQREQVEQLKQRQYDDESLHHFLQSITRHK